jgi:hypothetical protein
MTDDEDREYYRARAEYYRRKEGVERGRASANLTFIALQNEDMLSKLGALSELSDVRSDMRALREESVRELRGLRRDVNFGFLFLLLFLGYHLWRLYFS